MTCVISIVMDYSIIFSTIVFGYAFLIFPAHTHHKGEWISTKILSVRRPFDYIIKLRKNGFRSYVVQKVKQ